MSFSTTPQIESRSIEFSALAADIEENQMVVNVGDIVVEAGEERFDWEGFVILLRLTLFGMLLVGLALRQRELSYQPTLDPVPPKLFLDSFHVGHLKVLEGEVSSMWVLNLTISNVMNCSNVNIVKLEAKISYEEKENQTLAVITPIMPQYTLQREVLLLEAEETKRVHLKLSTTGWEESQPIVDDTVVQAIAQDVQRGATSFSLHILVTGEVVLPHGWVQTFTMYPKCTNLDVKFVAGDHQGEPAHLIHPNPRECLGLVQWGPVKDT
ncbi:hypothetical protein VNO78_17915 [Psophocarpus tetragonolobus]|uniref:Uncharacterized protein n=1 Tax=Psophocarpus tetragonolobus TaxID=3891 RepID=A0AAN9SII4_PSOTE